MKFLVLIFAILGMILLSSAQRGSEHNEHGHHGGSEHTHGEVADCHSQKDKGTGNAALTRYWYNPEAKECQEFTWGGGSKSNHNNYGNKKECESACNLEHNAKTLEAKVDRI